MRSTTKVLEDGRITVPYAIRESLELEHGDYVEIDVAPVDEEEGE